MQNLEGGDKEFGSPKGSRHLEFSTGKCHDLIFVLLNISGCWGRRNWKGEQGTIGRLFQCPEQS